MSPQGACAVCGRTLLVGEQVHSYISVEGRHEVCTLCAGRADEAGWLPAEQEGAEEKLRAGSQRKPGFFGRIFTRPEGEERGRPDPARSQRDELDELAEEDWEEGREIEPAVEVPPTEIHELETERYDVEAEWRGDDHDVSPSPSRRLLRGFFGVPRGRADASDAPSSHQGDAPGVPLGDADLAALDAPPNGHYGDLPHGHAAHLPAPDEIPKPDHSPPPAAPAPDAHAHPAPLPDPAGRGMRPRRLQPDLSPASRFERAVARFNSSDAGRTAAGLARTLGAPSVSVGDLAGEEDIVRVTVAWELTWYQWGIDLGDELRPVFELEKGYEFSEIDAAARQWNASALDGRIVMVAPPRREAEDGRPVHR